MYDAIVFNVFIASPADVEKEGRIVKERIDRWNILHSKQKETVLMPLMHRTHTPSLVGEHPQNIINEHVLQNADYLIAIFWSRIGTGATIREIETHVEKRKPAALFFCTKPIEQSDLISASEVQRLKNQYRDRSYYYEFRHDEEFKDMLDHNLNAFVDLRIEELEESKGHVIFPSRESNELSEGAKELIRNLAETGRPLRIQNFGDSYQIDSGSHTFYAGRDSRTYAEWKEFTDELMGLDLIDYSKSISHGEVYDLTSKGWKFSDQLNNQPE